MKLAEKIKRAVVIAPDPIGAIQSLLYEHYNKPINECLGVISNYTYEDNGTIKSVSNPIEFARELKSKLEAMRDTKWV